MKENILIFLQNDWNSILIYILTIIGIPISIFLYFKGKKEKSLKIKIKSNNIFKDFQSLIETVKITFKNQSISTLTITHILIWCNGKSPIYNNDIATKMPLTIKSASEILEAKISFVNNKVNDISLEKLNDNTYKINFEFLEYKDGFIIQIVHVGENSTSISVEGKIKGMKKYINEIYPNKKSFLEKIFNNYIFIELLFWSLLIIFPLIYIFIYLISFILDKGSLDLRNHLMFILFSFSSFLGIRTVISELKTPKEFQIF